MYSKEITLESIKVFIVTLFILTIFFNVIDAYANSEPTYLHGTVSPTQGDSSDYFRFETSWNDVDGDYIVYVEVRYRRQGTNDWQPSRTLTYIEGTSPPAFDLTYSVSGSPGIYEYEFRARDVAELEDQPNYLHVTNWRRAEGSFTLIDDIPPPSTTNNEPEIVSGKVTPTQGNSGDSFTFETVWDDPDGDYVVDVMVRYRKQGSSYWTGNEVLNYVTGTNPPKFRKSISVFGDGDTYEFEFGAKDSETPDGVRLHDRTWMSTDPFIFTLNTETPNQEPILLTEYVEPNQGNSGQNFTFKTTWDDPENDYVVDVKVRYRKFGSTNWIGKPAILNYVNSTYPPKFERSLKIIGDEGIYEYQFKASDANPEDAPRINTTDWQDGGTFIIASDISGVFINNCIGNNYEQQMPVDGVKLPWVQIVNPPTIVSEGQIITLTTEGHVDPQGRDFYYWCANQGNFVKDHEVVSSNYKTVKFRVPLVTDNDDPIKIYAQVGDTLGYIDTDAITLNVDSTLNTTFYSSYGLIYPDETIRKSVSLNMYYRAPLTFKVTWPGSDLDLKITTPSGEILNPRSEKVVGFYEGDTQEYYIVNTTEQGTWQVDIIAVDVALSGEKYEFSVMVQEDIEAFSKDSDGDGIPDAWEIAHGLDPFDPSDALADSDGDGLTNLDEYLGGTNPNEPECEEVPPEIHYVDIWQSGTGFAIVSINATDNESVADVILDFDGKTSGMSDMGGDIYKNRVDYTIIGPLTFSATATDACGNSTTFGPIEIAASWSGEYGWYGLKGKTPCTVRGNYQGTEADPVNTAIGNLVYTHTDASVAGLGETTLNLDRTYNSMASLWISASVMRYTESDLEGEMIEGPPLYYGKGWTSAYGMYLLEVEEAPFYDGVQVLYADGRTALFAKGGSTYSADSPANFDTVVKDGGEFALHHADCLCSKDTEHFNEDGDLTFISDQNGNRISLTRDGGNLSRVQNASGRAVAFTTNDDGRITQASLPESITLSYAYSDDLLSAFTNGRGNQTSYLYDGNDQLIDVTTPKGHSALRMGYDPDNWQIVEQIVGEGETYHFEYGDGFTNITDAYNRVTTHHYDDKRRLIGIDHPDGTTDFFEYDDDYNRIYHKDQNGVEWHWTYNEEGYRTSGDGPSGWHREWTYNDLNLVTRMTENVDASTTRQFTYNYDGNGNLTGFCNPMGGCGSAGYDGKGLITQIVDYAGKQSFYIYDGEGDMIAFTDAEGAQIRFDHDLMGRVIGMTKPMDNAYAYSYDANSNLLSVQGPENYYLEFFYDDNDNLSGRMDPNHREIKYGYNASDKLASVVNQLEFSAAEYAYGAMNELSGFKDAEGRSWQYVYDEMLRVVRIDGPLETVFKYDYNPVGRITDFTDANGIITHTDYDDLYRPVRVIRNYQPGGSQDSDTNVTVTYSYNLVGDVIRTTDPEGFQTVYEYDLMSRNLLKRDAENYEWAYEYDPMGNLLEMTNPRGHATSYEYSDAYRLLKIVNPESHATRFQYDLNGNLIQKTDPKNIVEHYDYDGLDRITRMIRNYQSGGSADSETNVTFAYEYDTAGNLRYLTNPRNFKAEFKYDANHRLIGAVDYEKGIMAFGYDRVNNLLSVKDAKGNVTSYAYDDLNRLTLFTNAEGESQSFAYDPMGNRLRAIQADGSVTAFGYDAIYRLNRVTENYREGESNANDVNVMTGYEYDARGLLTRLIDGNGSPTTYEYNPVGRMIRQTDPLGNVWQYTYDGVGNRISRTDANLDLTEYAYYPDDMIKQIGYADGSQVGYIYDKNNNLTRMIDKMGTTEWRYDPLNRITRTLDALDRLVRYAYDAADNRLQVRYADRRLVNYTFSPNNWMETATIPGGLETTYKRDRVGNITRINNPNSTFTNIVYDKVYRVLRVANFKDTKTDGKKEINSVFNYTYNEVGQVTEALKNYRWRNPGPVTETYAYDGLHRLIGAQINPLKNNSGPVIMAYSYDPVGNRLTWDSNDDMGTGTPFDGFGKTFSYDASNRLLNVRMDSEKPNGDLTSVFAYDANGNRINQETSDRNGPIYGTDYLFDPENRLIEALNYKLTGNKHKNRIDSDITWLEYDGGGRRLMKHYDPKLGGGGVNKELQYVFDGLDPIAEYNMLNGQQDNYYRGAEDRIITMQHFNSGARGQRYWYHYNGKGDVVGLTKHNGNSSHNYRYDPYGRVVPFNGNFIDPHNHFTLTGKEYDEFTDLVWFGGRHYDPTAGVWLTQDEYQGHLRTPLSLNRFSYATSDPINRISDYGLYVHPANEPKQMGWNMQIEGVHFAPFIEHLGPEGWTALDVKIPEPVMIEELSPAFGIWANAGPTSYPLMRDLASNRMKLDDLFSLYLRTGDCVGTWGDDLRRQWITDKAEQHVADRFHADVFTKSFVIPEDYCDECAGGFDGVDSPYEAFIHPDMFAETTDRFLWIPENENPPLTQLNRPLKSFIYNVAHELRTSGVEIYIP